MAPKRKQSDANTAAASKRRRKSLQAQPHAHTHADENDDTNIKTEQAASRASRASRRSTVHGNTIKNNNNNNTNNRRDDDATVTTQKTKTKTKTKPKETAKTKAATSARAQGSTRADDKQANDSKLKHKDDGHDGHGDGRPSYWLMKAEPESRFEKGVDVKFSIDDLASRTEPEAWDGVRNAMAQKNMRNMRAGELSFFYHSNCKTPGIAGIMQIVREQTPDESAFDSKHPYFDPKSDRANPRWCVVHVRFVLKFDELVTLRQLQEHRKQPGSALETLQTLRMSRLSVSQVSHGQWHFILGLANVTEAEVGKRLTALGPY